MTSERVETKIAILERMVARLDDYLDDTTLFKTITVYTPAGERLAKLTIGALLEHFDALQAREDLTDTQRQRLTELSRTAGRIKKERADAYYQRLARELTSYTDSWRWFLQTCEDGNRRCVTDYPDEVAIRLRIARLLEEAGDRPEVDAQRTRVRRLDERLRAIWEPGDFVLRDASPASYPRDEYWWLYGRPKVD